jgi:hypothetical protein
MQLFVLLYMMLVQITSITARRQNVFVFVTYKIWRISVKEMVINHYGRTHNSNELTIRMEAAGSRHSPGDLTSTTLAK